MLPAGISDQQHDGDSHHLMPIVRWLHPLHLGCHILPFSELDVRSTRDPLTNLLCLQHWGHTEAGSQWSESQWWEASLQSVPSDPCLLSDNVVWTSALNYELRTTCSRVFLPSSALSLLFAGSTRVGLFLDMHVHSHELLKLYSCLCTHPDLSKKHK